MDYDQRRLIVWPEWASSGLWHPEAGKAVPCPVTMVEHETIGLSSGLSAEFNRWIERYDDYNPPDETFDWDTFDKEGLRLANALALFVGDRFSVEYQGQVASARQPASKENQKCQN
jgi:hypothetical protein